MHMRVSSAVRKWSAALALLAIVAGAVGVTAVMIFGSMTAEPPPQAAPRTTLAPPTPKVPTAVEFAVNVIVTDAVIDSQASVVIDEAENRLHVQKAVMAQLLVGVRPCPSVATD